MKTKIFAAFMLFTMLSLSGENVCAQTNEAYDTNSLDSTSTMTTVQYCATYDDLKAGHWSNIDSVMVVTKSRTKQMWWGGKDFKFDSDNKATRRLLRKEAVAVMYRDTLLFNLTHLKDRGTAFGRGYARGHKMADGHYLILYFDVAKMHAKSMAAGMFGLVGGLAMAASSNKLVKQNVCYIVTPGEKKVTIINEKVMPDLLKDHPDLLEEYNQIKKKERTYAENIVPLLQRAGVLDDAE
uniref:GLPGLI family protein n=1 Tax=Prevotella sp. GTC17254 TaxID=3236794 RepID=A0AB33J080_9BACT